jgi:hypothetical protein
MTNDRYDNPRDDRLREQERSERERMQRRRPASEGGSERGFFERAGDEISSWFGDDEAERRREADERTGGSAGRYQQGRNEQPQQPRRDYGASGQSRQPEWDRNERNQYDRSQDHPRDDYRPFAGDYGRGGNPAERFRDEREHGRGIGGAIGAAAGAMVGGSSSQQPQPQRSANHDPHYSEWRQRQIDAIDNDYDEYRREHQSKFDNDFSSWRGHRQTKRQVLAEVREHMEVVGSDEQSVGKVDKVQGDKIILTRDSQGGVHKARGCTALDRIEDDRLILAQPAAEAKRQLVEERGFDERNSGDQRSMQPPLGQRSQPRQSEGPHNLERSFSGTYPRES